MSAIAYFLESEGLQTTGISLVRENTEALAPPRFLWTTFPLGRPLGRPNDPPFQRRVILAALDLLNRPSGPVLEDYPEDAYPSGENSDVDQHGSAMSCPINFSKHPSESPTNWIERLSAELHLMRPWFELSQRRRGRTTFGVAKLSAEECVQMIGRAADSSTPPTGDLATLKLAIEDAKAYWLEAMTAQPGLHDPGQINRQLWGESELSRALLVIHKLFVATESPIMLGFARAIAPRFAIEEMQGN